MLQFTEVIRNI